MSSNNFFNDQEASGLGVGNRYTNPYYNIPQQYLPQNMDAMLWWQRVLLFRNGFYRAALQRIACYFITTFSIDSEDSQLKEEITEHFESLGWRSILEKAGMDYLGFGNQFLTFNPTFSRFLKCPKCGKISHVEKCNFQFDKFKFVCNCLNPSCKYKGPHDVIDRPNTGDNNINVVFWDPRNVLTIFEETSNTTDYFWNIPKSYQQRLTGQMRKFYAKTVPEVVINCVKNKSAVKFEDQTFLHLKFPTPTAFQTDGRAVPPSMYIFDDLFMLQTLRKYNEVICFEDIAPFRVISMADTNAGPANPIFNQNGGMWRSEVENMVKEHRKDPAAYHVFAFPFHYEQLGGKGRELAPVDIMDNTKANILGSMNMPQELYNMNLQTQAVGPMLRLFENSWSGLVHNYTKVLQKWANVYCRTKGKKQVKISLMSTTLSDDIEKKQIIGQLVSANAIARSELLNLVNLDYEDQLRKKKNEEAIAKKIEEEENKKVQLLQQNDTSVFNGGGQAPGAGGGGATPSYSGGTPEQILEQAQEIAQELFPLSPQERRERLQQIKTENRSLYDSTKEQLEELTDQQRSSGVQQAQGQQGQGGQGQQAPQQ